MPNQKLRKFFDNMEAQGIKLTYDDVRLFTEQSDVVPTATHIVTQFSRNTRMTIPIVSSPMDTVTESRMAIALAEHGGIGVIHRGLNPRDQAKEVGRVKYRLNGRIETPIEVEDKARISEVLRRREENGYSFHTFPVLSSEGKLVGLLTNSDFDFCDDPGLFAFEVMTPLDDLKTAPANTAPAEAYKILRESKKKVLPLVNDDGTVAGMYLFSDLKRINNKRSTHNLDRNGQLVVAAAVGAGQGAFERAELLARKHCDVFVVDTAHGDSSNVYETVRGLKDLYPHIDVVAGNVSRGSAAKRLVDAGADGILVGQGPGSICTTRVVAGVGTPQVSAVYDCAQAVDGSGVPIIADGGINSSGDIAIALAVGASCVVLGRLLAGTDEAPGETRFFNGMQVKDYRGMGSYGAMRDNQSSRERYGQGALTVNKLVPEGVEGIVPYKGSVQAVLEQYVGGVRSSMGYLGALTLSDFRDVAEIFRMTSAGATESHPHDMLITSEAPNYSARK